ncbi:heat- shock protein [Nesidiocoris tenuis]|uniref:Heat- shock protein n=1 Tax=Nesidiocoris tenuis TaxID=355587 RepID=A0ABN7B542_9HEMI|nr:heat- shock protein [Nesidiocoris tenuis]
MDSGINGSSSSGSASPTGSQSFSQPETLVEAFNSQLCVLTPRMSPVGCSSDCSLEAGRETDNLVEEVYIAKHSISKGVTYAVPMDANFIAVRSPSSLMARGNFLDTDDELFKDVDLKCRNNSSPLVEKVLINVEKKDGVAPASQTRTNPPVYDIVVSIDLGTTYSGYAYAFARNPSDKQIHMMRQSEGGDRGLNNQKVPTVLLLTPEEKFHSFGFAARDFYHDLDPQEAKSWLYFDRFKMNLHNNMEVNRDSQVMAANGRALPAMMVYAHTLGYLKSHVVRELTDQGFRPTAVRWVLTVPALWTQQAKQFVREAAYMAEIATPDCSEALLIALEPEAASICCRHLHYDQIVNIENSQSKSGSYMVVDCGGGTVDITVHSVSSTTGTLRELHKATGGPCGSIGVDEEFVHLMSTVFGRDFMQRFRTERAAAYNELLLTFESRKRCATTYRTTSINIFPPFAFIDFYRQVSRSEVEKAVKDFNCPELSWSNEGILKMQPSLMYKLFQPTIDKIIDHVESVLNSRRMDDVISYLFLVGGFAESQILQEAIRDHFSGVVHIIIPQAVSLSVLKGGVLYGLNPSVVASRRVTHTYGLGVVKPFLNGIHPIEKLVIRGGQRWCVDVLERLIESGQPVSVGQIVSKKYAPASNSQTEIVLQVYATVSKSAQFITDPNVFKCGKLRLRLPKIPSPSAVQRKITVSLTFGGTEVTASATDSATGQAVQTCLDFNS